MTDTTAIGEKLGGEEFLDVEAAIQNNASKHHHHAPARSSLTQQQPSSIRKFFCYPSPNSLKIKSTSWLDGVRGIAALGVYIFHTMGCWASLGAAWHSDENQNSILQMPLLRTLFVFGSPAVALFCILSGYVLTYKSLSWMRNGSRHRVYPSLASSMFRRGFRLYIPPILVTFCEMLMTRFGVNPPLNFTFVPESNLFDQFIDWIQETNRFVNPVYIFKDSMQGHVHDHKYDPVIWTIPVELYGSFYCYIMLFFLAKAPSNSMRMGLIALFAGVCMVLGSWNLFCFSAGMLIADFNLSQGEDNTVISFKPRRREVVWMTIFAAAFYLAGFPSLLDPAVKLKPMPGYETIRWLIPTSLNLTNPSWFWWSISGVSFLLSISQLPRLKKIFETNLLQYLGRISFSLYLLHEFCLLLFGLKIQSILMSVAGLQPKSNTFVYWIACGIWYILFTALVFAVAARFEKWVDVPSVKFARWLEGKCLKIYRTSR